MAMSSSSSAAETSTIWGMFNRKNRLASQEEQEPFQEVVGRPSAAFYESMRIAKQRSQGSDAARQWSMEDDEDRDNRGKKVGTKTLLAACFFVIVGLVSSSHACNLCHRCMLMTFNGFCV